MFMDQKNTVKNDHEAEKLKKTKVTPKKKRKKKKKKKKKIRP